MSNSARGRHKSASRRDAPGTVWNTQAFRPIYRSAMKATEAKLLEFLKKSPQFVIPIYQRTYSWTEKECRQLWDDIVRTGSNDKIAVISSAQSFTSRTVCPKSRTGAVAGHRRTAAAHHGDADACRVGRGLADGKSRWMVSPAVRSQLLPAKPGRDGRAALQAALSQTDKAYANRYCGRRRAAKRTPLRVTRTTSFSSVD